jgi:hypothetical protein
VKPEWYDELPETYQCIFSEVYQALDNSLFFRASTGVRTALDCLLVEKIGNVDTCSSKVKNLCSAGMINSSDKDILLTAIDAGDALAHRRHRPG